MDQILDWWSQADSTERTAAAVLAGLIIAPLIISAVVSIKWARRRAYLLRSVFKLKKCAHCKRRTPLRSDSNYGGLCWPDVACCRRCRITHEAATEPLKPCPNGCGHMAKHLPVVAVVDVCPVCGGKFFDKGELGKLQAFLNEADPKDPDAVQAIIFANESAQQDEPDRHDNTTPPIEATQQFKTS